MLQREKGILGISAFSIFFYLIIFNFLFNAISLLFNGEPKLFIIGNYCTLDSPSIFNDKLFRITASITLIKFLTMLTLIICIGRTSKPTIIRPLAVIIVCFNIIEFYSLISFILDYKLNLGLFKYFAASSYIYLLGKQINSMFLTLGLNLICSVSLTFLVLKKIDSFNAKNILNELRFTGISVIALIVVFQLYKVFLKFYP